MKDISSLSVDLAGFGARVAVRMPILVRHFGALLETTVKRNASLPRSGPPGPRLQTGDYVRSIHTSYDWSGLGATVGTNRPQARRLEMGFAGPDANGRVYHQPPYPHFRPALDEIRPLFYAAVAAAVSDAAHG